MRRELPSLLIRAGIAAAGVFASVVVTGVLFLAYAFKERLAYERVCEQEQSESNALEHRELAKLTPDPAAPPPPKTL
jgi:hypothetical protein